MGGVIPPVLGLVTMPYIIHGLGAERFGVLSLAWAALGYFMVFDFGLGRATTKFTAAALGSEQLDTVPAIVWTAMLWQLGLSSLGGVLMGGVTPWLIGGVVKIPDALVPETRGMFYILGFTIPAIICSTSLRRVLEAAQRFDLANAVRIPAQTALFWVPAVAIYLGFDLAGIAFFLLLSQLAAGAAYLAAAMHALPVLKRGFHIDARLNRSLLSYGGWVTVYTTITPLLAYLDMFMVGALMTVTAVTFYAVPFEILMRVNYIVPSCLGATLFSAFSTLTEARRAEAERLYVHGLKYMLVSMGLLTLTLILFAADILRIWLGPEFAVQSTAVFQWLAIGFFLTGLGWLPTIYLQSMGRPDLVAKLFLIELAVDVPLAWLCIVRWGILGAAYAMVLRCALEISALLALPAFTMSLRPPVLAQRGVILGGAFSLGLAVASLWVAPSLLGHRVAHSVISAAILLTFGGVAWLWVLNESDREPLIALVCRSQP